MQTRANLAFRDLPSYVFEKHELPDEFKRFVARRILPKVKLTGYKRNSLVSEPGIGLPGVGLGD